MTATVRKWLIVGLIPLLACLACLFALQIKEQKAIPFCVEVESAGIVEEISVWENADGVYYVFLPGYAELANTRIKLNTAEPVYVNDIQLSNGMTCEAFKVDESYELRFSAWGEERVCQVTFVQSANVATMCIDTASGSMKYIHAEKGNEETGKIRLYTADGSLNYDGELESINGRGNNTWEEFEKKPYSIKLETEASLLGMESANKWILLANADDASNMRNKIVFDFAHKMEMRYSPDSEWLDLYINGEYVGLYLLCERNEVLDGRVELKGEDDFLVSMEIEERLISQKYTYIITENDQALRIYYPTEISKEDKKNLLTIWQSVENALLNTDGIDLQTGKLWSELINVDSWVEKYLVEEVFVNGDGCAISSFFYGEQGVIYAGPVWDYDHSIGTLADWKLMRADFFIGSRTEKADGYKVPWFYALYKKEDFYELATQKYQDSFLPLLYDLIDTDIGSYANLIEQSAKVNGIRWMDSYSDVYEQAAYLAAFLKERIAFLNQVWIDEKPYYTVKVDQCHGGSYGWFAVFQGETLQELPQLKDTQYQTFLGWYYADTNLPFDSTAPITEDTEIYAKWADSSYKRKEQIFKLIPLAVIACMGVGILWADIRRMRKGG